MFMWASFFDGIFHILGFILVATFNCLRLESAYHQYSFVVGAIVGVFMKLDAAWHEWSSVALAVMIDGILAVSAQCGCCHHFHTFLWFFYALSCI